MSEMPARIVPCCLNVGWLGFVAAALAHADQVIMTNGDRLTGRILQTDRDTVVLETSYSGTIAIERDQVRSLRCGSVSASSEPAESAYAAPPEGAKACSTDQAAGAIAHDESSLSPASPPDSQFQGRVNLAFSSERGNGDQDELDVDYEFGYRQGRHHLDSMGVIEFDTSENENTTDSWSSYNRYSQHFPSRMYGGFWLALKHDRFADLRLRTLAGPIVGYVAFEGEALDLRFEAGPMALQDDFYGQPGQSFLGPGWFLDFERPVWQEQLELYHRQFGYLAIDGKQKHLWQSWTGVRMSIGGGVTGSVEFEYDYDSAPAVEAETTDTTVRLKLGYQW
jgi:putative salt-induced outer membrane protein YdiY